MSEAKFTQGEWIAYYPHEVLNSGHVSIESEKGQLISIVKVHKSTLAEHTANANLIKASPKMYDILSSIENDNGQVPKFLWDKIQAVLTEARGETNGE